MQQEEAERQRQGEATAQPFCVGTAAETLELHGVGKTRSGAPDAPAACAGE